MRGTLYRLAAFTDDPNGGNPAGVWLGVALPEPAEMQCIAAEVGYSETAFIAGEGERRTVRYYSPEAEVSFCGHATVAGGVLLGQLSGAGTYRLDTAVGEVMVTVDQAEGEWLASLVSVPPAFRPAEPALVEEVCELLGWQRDELDVEISPARAYAGAWHLVMACKEKKRLERLSPAAGRVGPAAR